MKNARINKIAKLLEITHDLERSAYDRWSAGKAMAWIKSLPENEFKAHFGSKLEDNYEKN